MSWDKAKDFRTDEQVYDNYKAGKQAESLIIEKLREYTQVRVKNDTDAFKKLSRYTPDIEMLYHGLWRLVEIKFTKKKLRQVHLKENQYEVLRECHGLYLQVAGKRICLIDVREPCRRSDTGYCDKPVCIFEPKWRESFESLFL